SGLPLGSRGVGAFRSTLVFSDCATAGASAWGIMKHAKAIAIDPNTLFTMVFPFRGICAEYTPGLSAAIHKYGDVLLLASVGRLPLLARRGACAIKKKLRSNLSGA